MESGPQVIKRKPGNVKKVVYGVTFMRVAFTRFQTCRRLLDVDHDLLWHRATFEEGKTACAKFDSAESAHETPCEYSGKASIYSIIRTVCLQAIY